MGDLAQLQVAAAASMPVLQAKLEVGAPNDRFEQEADRVADQVMRMADPRRTGPIHLDAKATPRGVQRLCAECEEEVRRQPAEDEEEELRMKRASGATPEIGLGVQTQISGLHGGGQRLPSSVRTFFEPRFGHDFSQVRVHTDAGAAVSADAVAARAYTVGGDIVFASGQFSPQTTSGKQLLAHELTHVIQQRHAGFALQRQSPGSSAPPSCPTDIRVVKLHHIPFNAQAVAAGWRSGGGAVAEMEVSDPTKRDWAGTQIHETVTTVAETCGSISLCGNVGLGGAAGSTWPVGEASSRWGFNAPSKTNTFYDWHYSHIGHDLLGQEGLQSCESECEQTYDCVGGGKLSPKFAIERRLTSNNFGGQAVTQIAVNKPAKP